MKIVFVTKKPNKIIVILSTLPESVQIVSLESIGCQEAITETSASIEGNTIQKANYILENYGFHRFADETGLEVKV